MKTTILFCKCLWQTGSLFVFLLCSIISAQDTLFEPHTFTTGSGFEIPYRLVKPLNYEITKSYPLIVFLHGGGDVGTDNSTQLTWFPYCIMDSSNRVNYPCYIIAPQCPSLDIGWSSFPWYPDVKTLSEPPLAIATVLALIDSLRNNDSLTIDDDRIYVMGFSFGAEGTFDILTRRPELFAAAIPISGIGDTAKVYLYKDVPLWIFHGNEDDINDVNYSRMIVNKFLSLGVQSKYTEYDGMGHMIASHVYEEPDLIPWLFSQKKQSLNIIRHPVIQKAKGNDHFSVQRKGQKIELFWDLAVKPDMVEIYTINGRMVQRYPIVKSDISISIPVLWSKNGFIVKIMKDRVLLHSEYVGSAKNLSRSVP